MSGIRFRGGATSEDIAAITALLATRASTPKAVDAYERWRRTRLAALRRSARDDAAPPPRH